MYPHASCIDRLTTVCRILIQIYFWNIQKIIFVTFTRHFFYPLKVYEFDNQCNEWIINYKNEKNCSNTIFWVDRKGDSMKQKVAATG